MHGWKNKNGFTIVELLIVVVVIAILAAITIVAYNGIQNRAKASAVQNTAVQVSKKIAIWQVDNPSQVPPSLAAAGIDTANSTSTYEYSPGTSPAWCTTVTANNISYFVSNTSTNPVAGACPGHSSNGGAVVTNYATNPRAVGGGALWGNQTPSGGTVGYQANGAQDGGSTFRVVTTASGQVRMAIPQSVGSVVIGDVVSVSVDVYSSVATQMQIEVGLTTGVYPKSGLVDVNVGWNRISGSVTATANAGVQLVQLVGASSGAPSGTVYMATRAMVTRTADPYPYADVASNGSTWAWNGTANNSTSKGTLNP